MGNNKMEDLLNECIVMATECSEEYTVKFKRDGFQKLEIRRAVLASTSAPTYLPKSEIAYQGKLMTLVDGGVTMNNPAEYVYDHGLLHWWDKKDQILMLSLSCGYMPDHLKVENTMLFWAENFSNVSIDAQ